MESTEDIRWLESCWFGRYGCRQSGSYHAIGEPNRRCSSLKTAFG
jgi:hypothetical protein